MSNFEVSIYEEGRVAAVTDPGRPKGRPTLQECIDGLDQTVREAAFNLGLAERRYAEAKRAGAKMGVVRADYVRARSDVAHWQELRRWYLDRARREGPHKVIRLFGEVQKEAVI
jgi:hypothetical protein